MSYFHDEDFQEKLLAFVCRDRNFLKKISGILAPEDFKPRKDEGMPEAQYIAEVAFKFWQTYREPIGGMLRAEMQEYIQNNKRKIGNKQKDKILTLVDKIRHADGLVAVEAIERKVIEYKKRREMSRSIKELIELQEKGELTDKRWYKICKKAIEYQNHVQSISHYDEEVEKRIKRREKNRDRQFPALFIDPIDEKRISFPRGEFGIGLAKYNVGKSTFSAHLAKAYAMQQLKVLIFTLEDIGEMVEDRLDASLSNIPMRRLADKAKKLKRRLNKALERLRGQIKIIDGTDGGMSIARMEEIWENLRNQGFTADVVIIDYDEGVLPPEHYKSESGERREMMEIYKAFKTFVAKRELYGWMMAQTRRGKSGVRKMIVTGDDAAIDISKIKRCAFCIGIGDGPEEWGSNGRCLHIAKHRYDRAGESFMIAGDYSRAIFYDADLTKEMQESKKPED